MSTSVIYKFSGSHSSFSEEIIDKIISILEVDASALFQGGPETIKMVLWSQLDSLLRFSNNFSSKSPDTTPSKLRDHLAKSQGTLGSALDLLKNIQGEIANSDFPTYPSRERVITDRLREKSKTELHLSSGLMGWDWPRPFDSDLSSAILALERVVSHFELVLEDTANMVAGRGQNKSENFWSHYFLFQLCRIYRDFTGEIPRTAVKDDGMALGKVILFVEAVLPSTAYPLERTQWALEKAIRSLKEHPRYGKIWEEE
jgi:hypothetical protein